ncbi:Uroporphyrinogen-III synthase [Taenia crassiceps]|uniref:Uroporphyrinogen-III synthase n=1 Tax=Taenia crassiceps TaxID=6207 RepID=A0ABR4QKE5_9CEST
MGCALCFTATDCLPHGCRLPEDLCFTVGPATSSAASKLGFTTRGSHTGNAKNLAKFILDNYAKEVSEKPILLLTGARHSPVLPNRLREAGVLVEEVVLYCSAPNPNFETQLFSMLKKRENRSQYLVFFSPSGVEMAWPTLSKFISQSNYTIRQLPVSRRPRRACSSAYSRSFLATRPFSPIVRWRDNIPSSIAPNYRNWLKQSCSQF